MIRKEPALVSLLFAVCLSALTFGEEATVADPKRYTVELVEIKD